MRKNGFVQGKNPVGDKKNDGLPDFWVSGTYKLVKKGGALGLRGVV